MIEVQTVDGASFVSPEAVLSMRMFSEGPSDFSIDIQYQFGMVLLRFGSRAAAEGAMDTISKHHSKAEDAGYIQGFKDGCEYSLRLVK